jgi:hypothetical protein
MPKAKCEIVREVPFVLQTILPGACSQVEVRVEHDAITRPSEVKKEGLGLRVSHPRAVGEQVPLGRC